MNTPNKENSEVKNYSNSSTPGLSKLVITLFVLFPPQEAWAFSFYQFQIKIDIDLGHYPRLIFNARKKRNSIFIIEINSHSPFPLAGSNCMYAFKERK
jgi:hypothetical protein